MTSVVVLVIEVILLGLLVAVQVRQTQRERQAGNRSADKNTFVRVRPQAAV